MTRVADKKHITADIYSERDRGDERPRSLSRLARKKMERPGLERLVADREIVIAAGDRKRLRPRQQGDELRRVARKRIPLADRDQSRLIYARRLFRRQASARTANAGGERGAVALRLVGEAAEQALRRVGQAVERRRL